MTTQAAPAVPPITELRAPAAWRAVDFISDLHLMPSNLEPAQAALERWFASNPADALFILGDFFDVWVGDDAADADPFGQRCRALLERAAGSMAVFFMHGNRDFLVGDSFARRCGAELIADPTVLEFDGRRWLLTHGDALCLADTAYLAFRAQVREPRWQRQQLAKPLAERLALGRLARAQSEARKGLDAPEADVDAAAAREWLLAADAPVMIHGHTHRPAEHALGVGPSGPLQRVVLSDWDSGVEPPRRQLLRLEAGRPGPPLRIDL